MKMLNANNQTIARAISIAYCQENSVCQESLFNRLNTAFDDNTFLSFLSTLTNRAYLVGGFQNLGTLPGGLVKIKFVYYDVISGVSGSGVKTLPQILFNQNAFDTILKAFDQNLFFVKQNADNSTLFYNASQGYNIAYVTNPTSGGGGEGGTPGGGGTGGGLIVVPDYTTPGGVEVIETATAKSSFDFNSLIIPGAVLLGLYFFMNKD